MKPGEEPIDAARRALYEEIGVDNSTELHFLEDKEIAHSSESYPGLKSYFKTHSFIAVIPPDHYVPEGYVEKQAHKTNYYVWDLIKTKKTLILIRLQTITLQTLGLVINFLSQRLLYIQ